MRKACSFRSRRKRSFSTKGGKCAGDVEKRNDAYCDEKRCGLWFSCARNPRAMSGYAREENHFTSLAKVLTLPQRRILVEKIADRRGFGANFPLGSELQFRVGPLSDHGWSFWCMHETDSRKQVPATLSVRVVPNVDNYWQPRRRPYEKEPAAKRRPPRLRYRGLFSEHQNPEFMAATLMFARENL
ncbi:hypothetical protein V1477_019092, partial [Vespula maculifrons]